MESRRGRPISKVVCVRDRLAVLSPTEQVTQTRGHRINPRLRAAGWEVVPFDHTTPMSAHDKAAIEEFETANGPADYALCNEGRALGVVEAKKVTLGPQGVL